jgi:hypothetical protein
LQKYYGIKAEISQHLEPEDMQLMARVAQKYAALQNILLEESIAKPR